MLTEEDWKAIDELTASKYKNWEWNYGQSPQYSDYRDGRFACGTIQCYLEVVQGRISNCRIYGDFFAKGNVQEVEEKLKGVRMVKEDLVEVLSAIDLSNYFGAVTAEEFAGLVLGE